MRQSCRDVNSDGGRTDAPLRTDDGKHFADRRALIGPRDSFDCGHEFGAVVRLAHPHRRSHVRGLDEDRVAEFGLGAHDGPVDVASVAVHDVGRAVNPGLVEGQVEGGVAQGIGLALMEEYVPGRSENLHDYLIPSIGDVPEVVTILVESNDPRGPFGAKGIGEHALVPTAPAIVNAIRDAVGAPVRDLPATPERVLDAARRGGHA